MPAHGQNHGMARFWHGTVPAPPGMRLKAFPLFGNGGGAELCKL
jgi:hypothetical protein